MPGQVLSSVENNFTKGLVTEFTGLNFPENAAVDTDNCLYTLVGDVVRRQGIDIELNGVVAALSINQKAITTYLWKNAGGDGSSTLLARQIGKIVFLYNVSTATLASPLSNHLIGSVDLSAFSVVFSLDETLECQYADGNGYLFLYHLNILPIYVTYSSGVVQGHSIDVKIRDFTGIPESIDANFRPQTLSIEHQYNLVNQGWISGNPWSAPSITAYDITTGSHAFGVPAGIVGVVGGTTVKITYTGPPVVTGAGLIPTGFNVAVGLITSYVGTTMTINVTLVDPTFTTAVLADWAITPISSGYINTWFASIGNYPSNADVWWYFKNASGVFDPTVSANTSLASGNSPKGHFILSAFNQQKATASGLAVTNIITSKRPSTGTWFQGRVWYTGLDDTQAATGDAPFYTWTENIYFSQIVTGVNDFGNCYQVNDPTSEQLFGLLPSDGGVITVQGSGKIYKLFPLQNALLIFAANGVWYLTGSQGIGFTANDYTIVKLSSVRSISSTSFVDVQGLPYFWNEEGIYAVQPAKQGPGLLNSPLHVNPLEVIPITVGTIQTFYDDIPLLSKKYARGDYDPINYQIQWIYKSTQETSNLNTRYEYDRILNFNSYNKSFFPYTLGTGSNVHSINYIFYPGSLDAPPPSFKYYINVGGSGTFADEHDISYRDFVLFNGSGGIDYESFFVTGYKLHGQGQRRFQIPYIYIFSRSDEPTSYKIQGLWDYATAGNSGRWSTPQLVQIDNTYFGMGFKRHRIRGQGLVLQIKVKSSTGQPFDIMGWSSFETQNTGI